MSKIKSVLLYPFKLLRLVVIYLWVVSQTLLALIGIALGQVTRLLAFLAFFIVMYTIVGWAEARNLMNRGNRLLTDKLGGSDD